MSAVQGLCECCAGPLWELREAILLTALGPFSGPQAPQRGPGGTLVWAWSPIGYCKEYTLQNDYN